MVKAATETVAGATHSTPVFNSSLAAGACAKHLREIVPYVNIWTAVHENVANLKGVTEAGIWALVDSCPRMETLNCFGKLLMDKGLLSVLCSRGIRHHARASREEYFDLTKRHGMLLRSKSASAGEQWGQACL